MFAVFSLSTCIHGRHETERSSKECDLVEKKMGCDPRTATDRMCTDAWCKQSLRNGGSWTRSNRSQSNIVILHTRHRCHVGWDGDKVIKSFLAPNMLSQKCLLLHGGAATGGERDQAPSVIKAHQ